MHLTLQHQTGQYAWYLCKCGTGKLIRPKHVNSGRIKSCGCVRKENMQKLGKKSLSSLTEDDVRQIKKLLSDGEKQAYIAYIFKIHQTSVSRIKRGVCSKKLLNI